MMEFTPTFKIPLDCGKRLLPAVLDEIATKDPQRTFISVPVSSDLSEGFRDISYGTFGKAVDKYAGWLRAQIGDSGRPKTILFYGPLDLRYLLVFLGTPKAGHIPFFSSHRNSIEAHQSIAEKAGCETILVPEGAPAMLSQILEVLPLRQIAIPPLSYFLQDLDEVKYIPFTLTWEEAKDKPLCVLHTSGSTGIPKPVFVTYGTFACNDAHQLIPQLGGKPTLVDFLRGKRYFLALPLFHAACLTFAIGYNIFAGVTCVIPPPEPLTADMMNQVYKYANLDGALLAPSLIVDCYNNSEYYKTMLSNLKFLSYVGGSLPEEVGNEVTKRIKLMTLMGSCETALHPLEMNDDIADWQYLTISKYLGHTFVEHKDGHRELVIERNPDCEIFQGVFSTFPEKEKFISGDLFEQHPSRSQSWVFRARTDDIIAFTTAEKLNPVTMESTISTNPKIKSAVIGGKGRFQASLLIEPHTYPESAEQEAQFIKHIWPSVLQANRACPAHGRIMKGFVMLAKPGKPIPRAGKGTVQRHAALELYKTEFEDLYDRVQPTIKEIAAPVAVPGASAQRPAASIDYSSAKGDIDARLEKVLTKVLPGMLDAAIQKAFSQMLLGLRGATQPPMMHPSKEVPTKARIWRKKCNTPDANLTNGSLYSAQQIRAMIYDELAENLDLAGVSDDTNLFDAGLDSLQVQSLLTILNDHLTRSKSGSGELDVKSLYENPTVREIMSMIGF